jgi:hypothetical protein
MRHCIRCLPLLILPLLLLSLTSCRKADPAAAASGAVRIKEDGGVRIGLPSINPKKASETPWLRTGSWSPVYVTLVAGKKDVTADTYRIQVEAYDQEDGLFHYTVAVPNMAAEEERVVVAYMQPGNDGSSRDVTIKLLTADGQTVQTLTPQKNLEILEARYQIFAAVGGGLSGLKQATDPPKQQEQAEQSEKLDKGEKQDQAPAAEVASDQEGPLKRFTVMQKFSDLPDLWIGYESVDLVVLVTRNNTFMSDLLKESSLDSEKKLEALTEWVRRGGRLVLSVGSDQQAKEHAQQLLERTRLLKCKINPATQRKVPLVGVSAWAQVPPGANLEVEGAEIQLTPGSDVRVLVSEKGLGDGGGPPVILQGACGMGRVWLVAFDLDSSEFNSWGGRPRFWEQLLKVMAPLPQDQQAAEAKKIPQGGPMQPQTQPPTTAMPENLRKAELLTGLQRGLEDFSQEVAPIGFGWVALFILLYIVLVGPLDYLVLKKVFKRLELTWLTFPVVVLAVSVGAYLIAYACKGDDLRIRKIDVVDIDLHDEQPRAYGRAWFTLFSPRIQYFTVGLQPATPDGDLPGWVAAPSEDAGAPRSWLQRGPTVKPAYPVVVTVMAVPERSLPGGRSSSTSLAAPAYDYAEGASGVDRVPIPVWATRTFQASWSAPLDKSKMPIVADVYRSRADDKQLAGTITNNLPCELRNVTLFYKGQWYGYGNLAPGKFLQVSGITSGQQPARGTDQWFSSGETVAAGSDANRPITGQRGRIDTQQSRSQLSLLKSILFREKISTGTREAGNSGLRPLDQSWRITQDSNAREEIILVAQTTPVLADKTEDVNRKGVSPTRIWIDHLPGSVAERPALDAYLTQDTYVRVYIPIKQKP